MARICDTVRRPTRCVRAMPLSVSPNLKRWMICLTSYISNLLLAIASALGKITEGYAIGSPIPSFLPSMWLH